MWLIVVVILFPTEYNKKTVCMNSRVIIDIIVMWLCWWPPEKPWAYQAGSHWLKKLGTIQTSKNMFVSLIVTSRETLSSQVDHQK